MPFWKRWRIFWFLWTAAWLAPILLRPDYRTPVPHYITGEMYFPDSWPHSLTLVAVYAFLPLSSAFLSLLAFFRRHKAVFWLTGALLHGVYLALFGLAAMHNASTAFGMALSAVLLGCLAQFAALLYFFCACQQRIMLRRISGAGCLQIRRFCMKGFLNMKHIASILLLALGMTAQATYAAPAKNLPLDDTGCIARPLTVKRGETYRFRNTAGNVVLTVRPVSPDIVVKGPNSQRIALEKGTDIENGDGFSFADLDRKGRYSITFPRAGKVEQLCVNAAG